MQIKKPVKTILVGLILSIGLTACGSMNIWRAEKPEPCPRITVLGNASEITKFKEGPGRDLIDVVFSAEISNVLNLCKYDVDYDSRDGNIHVQLSTIIAGKRGPADKTHSATIPYFVAIVDQDKKILQKSNFNLKLAFPGNLSQNEVKDEVVDLTIPVSKGLDGRDFEIYIGLQLNREQIAYNLRQKQR